jgi:methyltransferase (TIGR00027 family)
VAAARGGGALLPDTVRLADDPYGAAFTSPRLQQLLDSARARGPSAVATMPGLGEWVLYMQVRTRLLDDAVREFARDGGKQVVLLGAGYDCRALRLRELARAAVFEVDHPATQRHKRDVLARMGARSPSHYLAWDFERQPVRRLPAALVAAGHDPDRPTITVWEGVTMYLTEPAIEESVDAIATYSASRSVLAMTYSSRARLARPHLAGRAIAALVARVGEPWRWGWDPEELPDWMAARGFQVERDVCLADAARELLPHALARRVSDPGRRVAIAAREPLTVAGNAVLVGE